MMCTQTSREDGAEALADVPLSTLAAAMQLSLSEAIFDAMAHIRGTHTDITGDASIALKVGESPWCVVVCLDGAVDSCSRSPDLPHGCSATLTFSSEATLSRMMDGSLSDASAVAMRKLKVSGSQKVAAATEVLFDRAEQHIRANARHVASADAAAAARQQAEAAAAEVAACIRRANARSFVHRWQLRHCGTEQQLGAWLMVLGSLLFVVDCWIRMDEALAHPPAYGTPDIASPSLYLASAVTWLLGIPLLLVASYPEEVLRLAVEVEQGARATGKPAHVTVSSTLVGAWGLFVGSVIFLAGASVEVTHHPPSDVTPALYFAAGIYLILATGLLVFGAMPEQLIANDGQGSTMLAQNLGGGSLDALLERFAPNDATAGMWFFTLFLLIDCAYGTIDLAVERTWRAAFFLVGQLPFAAGAWLLTVATYPDALNRALFGWDEALEDEMLARGLHPGVGGSSAAEQQLARRSGGRRGDGALSLV